MTGSASRKTDPQAKCSRSRPPSSGPMALPAEKADTQIAIAVVRCFGSSNIAKMSESVDGAIVAPAIPSSARLAMSICGVVENAASSETSPNAAAPMSSSRRRPIRSPRVPIVIRNPATMNPYTSMIQSSSTLVGLSERLIAGTARWRTVRSMT